MQVLQAGAPGGVDEEAVVRATLEFDLPEEQGEFVRAVRGAEYASALSRVLELIRRARKDATTPAAAAAIDRLSDLAHAEAEHLEE